MLPMTDRAFETGYAEQLRDCLRNGVRQGDGKIRKQHTHFEWVGLALIRGARQDTGSAVTVAKGVLSGFTDFDTRELVGLHNFTGDRLLVFKNVDSCLHLHVTDVCANALTHIPSRFAALSVLLQIVSLYTRVPAGRIHYTCNDFYLLDDHEGAAIEYLKRALGAESWNSKYKHGTLAEHYATADQHVYWTEVVFEWVARQRDNMHLPLSDMLDSFYGKEIINFDNYAAMPKTTV